MAISTLKEAIEAISVLAHGHIDLETVVKAMGELVKAQDLKLRQQQTLIDNMQAILIDAGLAKPRPKKDPGGKTN